MTTKKYNSLFILILLGAVLLAGSLLPTFSRANTSISGWAWSKTIGWISLNGTGYGLTVDGSNNLTGYAWSSNVGWIKFGGLSGFPSGSGTTASDAKISGSAVVGWARACKGTASGDCSSMTSRADGWDGWIALSGTGYGVTYASGALANFAWGGDVVGWVSFTGSYSCTPTSPVCSSDHSSTSFTDSQCTNHVTACSPYVCSDPTGSCDTPVGCLSINAPAASCKTLASIRKGTPATLFWNVTNTLANGCSITANGVSLGSSLSNNSSISTGNLNTETTFLITCTSIDSGKPSFTASAVVNMTPVFKEI